MKALMNKFLAVSITVLVGGCTTYTDQFGQSHQGLSETGAAVLQTAVAVGVGAGSGALLKNQPGWANGAVSSLAGSVAGQFVNSLAPRQQGGSYQSQPSYQQNGYPRQATYNPGYGTQGGYPQSYPPARYNRGNYGDYNTEGGYSGNSPRVFIGQDGYSYEQLTTGQVIRVN